MPRPLPHPPRPVVRRCARPHGPRPDRGRPDGRHHRPEHGGARGRTGRHAGPRRARHRLRPEHADGRDPRAGRRDLAAAGRRRDVGGAVEPALPPRHLRHARRAAADQGRLLHRGRRSRRRPVRRRDQRQGRGLHRCPTDGPTQPYCVALNNFWRSLSNLTLDVNGTGQDGCRASANFFATSQAASLRRVDIRGGNLSLMDYCTEGPQYASGGYLADSRAGTVINGSQQQC